MHVNLLLPSQHGQIKGAHDIRVHIIQEILR